MEIKQEAADYNCDKFRTKSLNWGELLFCLTIQKNKNGWNEKNFEKKKEN